MSKVVVIGGGFGGIAAALRMRAKGYQVTLIDRCSELGGRAQVFKRNGFIFDAGPTVITAPYLFNELFALFDKDLEDYIQFVPVEPWYRFAYPDGSTFDYGGTLEDTLKEIENISPADVAGYKKLLAVSEKIFDVGFTGLADKPFHSVITMIKQIPHLARLRCYRSVYQLVSQHLKHDKLRQAFTIQPLLVGGNPFDTTSIYNLIHFLERKWGIHYAMGGTGKVVKGLEQLMVEQGIEIRLNTTAESFVLEGKRIKGIRLADGDMIDCDKVVSNIDPTFLYDKVIEKQHQPLLTRLKTRHAKLSMGLYVLYFGTNKKFHDVPHHTIWLGKRYRALLDDIFNKKVLADDFSLYLHRPSATDPSMAPDDCDCFYVLSPVPNLQSGLEWDEIRDSYRDKILTALDQTIMPGVKDSVIEQFDMTPKEFQQDYLSTAGAGFSIAPILRQSAWFRYHNKGEGLDNLYLVGAGTHPGAGLPGVLSSAKVLDHLVPSID
ncbi:MAG: phytoene dehydrogenase [Cellvibrionales bacterium]|jgi:phytoene desaturase|nr:phytoene dehydrogenase [Cellvibrionales bacterium]